MRINSRQGFSLLELSVVLTIIAIVLASALTLTQAKTKQIAFTNTHEELRQIAKSIAVFVNQYGCMPYPSSLTAKPGELDFGREPAAFEQCQSTGGDGVSTIKGGIPFYSLGLPDEYAADSWETRYTYVVTENAVEAGFSSAIGGGITVTDGGANNITTEAVYTLFSHGPSRKGGYTVKAGTALTACNSAEKDGENCDTDLIFIDSNFNDGDVEANFFDDILLWSTASGIFEYTGSLSNANAYRFPSNVILTSSTHNGDFGGYSDMMAWISTHGCPSTAGYKVCSAADIARYVQEGSTATGEGWVIGAEDCNGWNSSSSGDTGASWSAAVIDTANCNSLQAVQCCQWN